MILRVFISEYLVGGAVVDSASTASMQREGLAMLKAIAEDISRLPDCRVVTTLDAKLPHKISGEVIPIKNSAHEAAVFQSLLREVDAVLVIAPETDGVLVERCRQVRSADVISWNCSLPAIELCSDKLRLANHLQSFGLPTIPTKRIDREQPPDDQCWPAVLKPIDGAGSFLTFLVQNPVQWMQAVRKIREGRATEKCIAQPFFPGRTLSIGVNISLDGQQIECLAVGEQNLSDDHRFRYLGGTIPAMLTRSVREQIEQLVRQVCRSIPGLAGYIGMDLILTEHGDPIIVEINPRLTTAYVGYRELYSVGLPDRWLSVASTPLAAHQKSEPVEFVCADF